MTEKMKKYKSPLIHTSNQNSEVSVSLLRTCIIQCILRQSVIKGSQCTSAFFGTSSARMRLEKFSAEVGFLTGSFLN